MDQKKLDAAAIESLLVDIRDAVNDIAADAMDLIDECKICECSMSESEIICRPFTLCELRRTYAGCS